MSTSAPVTPERIMQFTWGYVPTLLLETAIRRRVFDVLDAGPKTLKETAAATGTSERGLRIVMNALVGLDFLAKNGQQYALTPESEAFLVSTKPGFQGGIVKNTSAHLIRIGCT
jgi:Dimerisation domain